MSIASNGRVVVLAGGLSPERDVSIRSGRRVADALRVAGVDVGVLDVDARLMAALAADRPACVVPLLHGRPGEDGAMRDVLVALGLPFVGLGALGVPSGVRQADRVVARRGRRGRRARARWRCRTRPSASSVPPRCSTPSWPGSASRSW